jgi:hypothetical protein
MFAGALNLIHAVAQGVFDVRRTMAWIDRDQCAPTVGIAGLSLGGLVSSLVASLEPRLAVVIAGIPESDVVRGIRRQVEWRLPSQYEQWGLSWAPLERITRVVSPLEMVPLVPHDRRFIFSGLADRWVRPGNVHALWEHWDRPEICWYQGSHLSFMTERKVHRFFDDALRRTGLVSSP